MKPATEKFNKSYVEAVKAHEISFYDMEAE